MIVSNDTKDAQRGGQILALVAQAAGIKPDGGSTIPKSGMDPQSAYTTVVQGMKSDNSNYSLMTSAANADLELRNEAALQEGSTAPRSCGSACRATATRS